MKKQQRDETVEFIRKNLKQCCIELLEWHKKAVLRDGKMREADSMCREWLSRDSLGFVERTVSMFALEFVVNHGE